jgi:hypothetical protein
MKPTDNSLITRLRKLLPWLLATLLLFLSWSMLQPIGSEPDEHYHTVYAAAVARGEVFLPIWYRNPSPIYGALVPKWITSYRYTLLAFPLNEHVKLKAGLVFNVNKLLADKPTYLAEDSTDLAALPPFPYYLYGLPTLYSAGSLAVFQMRFIADLIDALFLSYSFYLLKKISKVLSLSTLFFLLTPEVFSLGSYPNPNGAEICATLALSVVTALVITEKNERLSLMKRWLVIASALCLIRTLSPLWVFFNGLYLIIGLGISEAFSLIKSKALIKYYAVLILCGSLTGFWDVLRGHYSSPQFLYLINDYHLLPFNQRVIVGIKQLPTFLNEAFYNAAMLPRFSVLEFLWLVVFGTIIVAVLLVLRNRYKSVVITSIVVAILTPALIQAITAHLLGQWWNGRYSAMLYLEPAVLAVLFLEENNLSKHRLANHPKLVPIINALLLILAALINGAALYNSLRLYMVGPNGGFQILFKSDSAWASYPHGFQSLWILAFVLGLALYFYKTISKPKAPPLKELGVSTSLTPLDYLPAATH